jgi:hypothetical protein
VVVVLIVVVSGGDGGSSSSSSSSSSSAVVVKNVSSKELRCPGPRQEGLYGGQKYNYTAHYQRRH